MEKNLASHSTTINVLGRKSRLQGQFCCCGGGGGGVIFLSITMHAAKFWLSSYFHARLLRLYFNKLVHFAKLSSVILRLICPLSISRITREGKNPIGLPVDSYVSIRSALFPAFYIMNQLKNIQSFLTSYMTF